MRKLFILAMCLIKSSSLLNKSVNGFQGKAARYSKVMGKKFLPTVFTNLEMPSEHLNYLLKKVHPQRAGSQLSKNVISFSILTQQPRFKCWLRSFSSIVAQFINCTLVSKWEIKNSLLMVIKSIQQKLVTSYC